MAKILGYEIVKGEPAMSLFEIKGPIYGASIDGKYRYRLWRIWDESLPKVLFIMLNPSTADGLRDDPTIRRCMKFAKAWGFGGIYVGNLFAYRSTDPDNLYFHYGNDQDIVGPENDKYIDEMATMCQKVVFAWGNYGGLMGRGIDLAYKFQDAYCLGHTKIGHPAHPLYLKKTTELKPFKAYKFDDK
jgi:hypothetical protein